MSGFDLLRRAATQDIDRASSDYDLNPALKLPRDRQLKPAAVLIACSVGRNGLDLWLTKRSTQLKHHPGQIAFPGGKVDEGDQSPERAALREAHEEIGLPQDAVELLGALPPHETVTAYSVTPILARITKPFAVRAEVGEVSEVFTVPLSHVLTPENYIIETRPFRGQSRQFYTVPYGPYYIWGATARILRGLAERAASL